MALALEIGFVVLFTIAWPLYEWRIGYPKMLRALARGVDAARSRAYGRTMIEQWTFTAMALLLWALPGRPFSGLGLGFPHPGRFAIGLALALALIGLLTAQKRAVLRRPELFDRLRAQFGAGAALVPHTRAENRLWIPLCVTAGVCEEILFRGFLVTWLTTWVGPAAAWTLAIVLFGGAHIYLGTQGAIRAGFAGAFMAALYAFTGSLWVSMLLHAAVDMNSGSIGFGVMSAEAQPAAPAPASA